MSKILMTSENDSLLAQKAAKAKATTKILIRQNKTSTSTLTSTNAKESIKKSLGSTGSTSSRSSSFSGCSMATQTAATATDCSNGNGNGSYCSVEGIDFDDFTANTSIMEFLRKEQECDVEYDTESIFQEVSRLTDNSESRSIEEILREAESLMQQQPHTIINCTANNNRPNSKCKRNKQNAVQNFKKNKTATTTFTEQQQQLQQQNKIKINDKKLETQCNSKGAKTTTTTTKQMHKGSPTTTTTTTTNNSFGLPTPQTPHSSDSHFTEFVDNLPSESVLSEESTPKDLHNLTVTTTENDNNNNHSTYNKYNVQKNAHNADDTDEGTDTVSEQRVFFLKFFSLFVDLLGMILLK